MTKAVGAAICFLGIGANCRAPAPPAVVEAQIIVVPASGGMAQFGVHRDGTIKGGHLSGGPRPFVHEDTGHLDAAVTDSLWVLVRALQDSLPPQVSPTGKGYVELQLNYAGATSWTYAWPSERKAPHAKVQAVADWLLAHKIGGW